MERMNNEKKDVFLQLQELESIAKRAEKEKDKLKNNHDNEARNLKAGSVGGEEAERLKRTLYSLQPIL